MKNSQLKKHLGYWVNRLQTQIHKALEQSLSQYGISASEWSVLVSLHDDQASSVTELAGYIEINKSAVSRLVYQLTQKNMIIVKPGKDRRSEKLVLSAQAKKILPEVLKQAELSERTFFGVLSEEEIGTLKTMLERLLSADKKADEALAE